EHQPNDAQKVDSQAEKPTKESSAKKTDLYGDPLPPGAVARLGTTRFRHGGWYLKHVAFLPDNETMVTVADGEAIVFWEAKSGKRLREIRTDPMGIQGFALSRDGKQIA